MFSSFQKDFDPAKNHIELADGNHMNKLAEGRCQAKTDLKDSQGTVRPALKGPPKSRNPIVTSRGPFRTQHYFMKY